jgi:hypothetical protein
MVVEGARRHRSEYSIVIELLSRNQKKYDRNSFRIKTSSFHDNNMSGKDQAFEKCNVISSVFGWINQ